MQAAPPPVTAPSWVIGLGASAGGVEALTHLVGQLPAGLPAAVVVVLHLPADAHSVLPAILDRAGHLPAHVAVDGEPLRAGQIAIAPPDRHLVVEHDRLRLEAGPRLNGHRPAIDATFASMAHAFGTRAIGVLLSGTLDDGSRGMFEIGEAGGPTLVQDPSEARYAGMIVSAMRATEVDAALRLDDLAVRITELVEGRGEARPKVPATIDAQTPTRYTCPDCGGVLWRHDQAGSRRYVCSVGHAYSPASLAASHDRSVEVSLWAAARILGDRRTLLSEMAERAEQHGRSRGAVLYRKGAAEAADAASAIRSVIERNLRGTDAPVAEER